MNVEAANPTRKQKLTGRLFSNRWGRWLLLLAILLAGVLYKFRPQSLLERSTSLVSLKEIRAGQMDTLTPVWRNDHELLLLHYPDAESVKAERLETMTGKRSPAPDIERVLHPANAIPIFSPDGKWMLLTAQSAEKETMDRLLWIARPVEGDDEMSWFPADPKAFSQEGYQVIWLPDSRHVAEFLPYYRYGMNVPLGPLRVHIHDVQTGDDTALMFRIPASAASFGVQTFAVYPLSKNRPLLLRMDAPAVTSIGWRSVSFFVWENTLPEAPPRSWKVTSPPEYNVAAARVSPDGQRIAWVFTRIGLSPLQSLLTRLHLAQNTALEYRFRVAVSNLDGSGMRSLGELTLSESDIQNTEQPWDSLQWLPGNKRLSYIYRDVLYTLPVD